MHTQKKPSLVRTGETIATGMRGEHLCIDFRIQGDRMNPEFMEGETITVDHGCKPQTQ